VDEFWGAGKRLRNVQYFIEPPAVDRALLRRLGPPPFASESMSVYDRLSAVYEQVSDVALALAYATDESELVALSGTEQPEEEDEESPEAGAGNEGQM
jgi:hypothetical protein